MSVKSFLCGVGVGAVLASVALRSIGSTYSDGVHATRAEAVDAKVAKWDGNPDTGERYFRWRNP